MALTNHPLLYTGGGERLDSRPHTALYAQLMQRKQAKEDALDQYYQNLHKSINPAGMRTKDIEGGWSKKVQDWTTHGITNRSRIRNPKTPEDRALANENMSMYQDILMDTSKSKEAAAQEMELAKQKISGKWNPTDDDMNVASSIGASIYDPQYYKDPDIRTKPYTLNDLSLNVPQVTPKEQEEFYKAAVGNLKPGKTYDETKLRRDKISGQVFIPYQQSYESDAVKKIGDNAGVLFPGSRTPIGVHYEKLLHDPNFFEEANQAYQSVYGKDEIVDTPKKAAQAAAIMNTRADVSTGEEIRNDESLDFQRQKEMEAIRQANRERNMRRANDYILARESYKRNQNAKVIDEYVESQYNDPNATAAIISHGGKQYDGKFIKAPKSLTDKYSINRGTKDAPKWDDPEWILTSDKKYIFPVYKKGEKTKGGWDKVSSESKPISVADYKIEISNDWIKSNRTANELADEFDAEGEVDESRSSTNIIRTSKPVKGNHPLPAGKPRMIKQGDFDYVWDEETGTYQ